MESMTRRRAISTLGLAGPALIAGRAEAEEAKPPASETPRAFLGQHQPRPLPFDAARLKRLSERLVRSHWENNYLGAVKALNAVEQRLDALRREADTPPWLYGDLKREELVRTGSVVLHERYFGNLGGDGRASGAALALVKRWFGAYEAWEAEFKRTAAALSGGSGWAVLALDLHTGEAHNYWQADHAHQPACAVPLLVLDMYEHAYHIDFGAAAARYVDAFLDNVQWDEVSRRAEWAARALSA